MLASRVDKLERRRAFYTALAFHDPSRLRDDGGTKTIRATKANAAEILSLVNG